MCFTYTSGPKQLMFFINQTVALCPFWSVSRRAWNVFTSVCWGHIQAPLYGALRVMSRAPLYETAEGMSRVPGVGPQRACPGLPGMGPRRACPGSPVWGRRGHVPGPRYGAAEGMSRVPGMGPQRACPGSPVWGRRGHVPGPRYGAAEGMSRVPVWGRRGHVPGPRYGAAEGMSRVPGMRPQRACPGSPVWGRRGHVPGSPVWDRRGHVPGPGMGPQRASHRAFYSRCRRALEQGNPLSAPVTCYVPSIDLLWSIYACYNGIYVCISQRLAVCLYYVRRRWIEAPLRGGRQSVDVCVLTALSVRIYVQCPL